MDRLVEKADTRRVGTQPAAAAPRTGDFAHQLVQPLPIDVRHARRLFDRGEEPLVLEFPFPFFAVHDPAIARAMQHEPLLGRLEPLERHVERHLDLLRPRLDHPGERVCSSPGSATRRSPLCERALGIGNQGRQIGSLLGSQALARRAPAERTVERETVRRELFEAAAALMAGEMQAVAVDNPFFFGDRIVDAGDEDRPAAQIEGRLDRAGDSRAGLGIDGDAVDDDLDGVLATAIDLRHVFEPIHLAVDPHPQKTLQLHPLPQRVVALADGDFLRREQNQLATRRQGRESCRRSGRRSASRPGSRIRGNKACRVARRGSAGSRRFRSRCRQSNAASGPAAFCSMAMAGDRPWMCSTFGLGIWPRNWRA